MRLGFREIGMLISGGRPDLVPIIIGRNTGNLKRDSTKAGQWVCQQSTERTKTMDNKKMILFISDKMGIAAALVRTAGIAVGNQEVFMEDGQAVAITLEAAGTELRRCRNVAEAYLQRKQQE